LIDIADNIKRLKERIYSLCIKSGRKFEEIEFVAATKGVSVEKIEEAISCGIKIIGENKVQEAKAKFPLISKEVKWHLIGHLQTNKVKTALNIFDFIHSLDSLSLAEELDKRSRTINKKIKVLVEVNTGEEESKFGVKPENVFDFFDKLTGFNNLEVCGLMTMAAFTDDNRLIRKSFIDLRSIKDKLGGEFEQFNLKYLSMGMSNDFEIAIEEGANMLRIGRAIFHKRR
jgi:pyridoxal phosphate enzyme (YggS family)